MLPISAATSILIINCALSILALNNPQVMNRLILTPYWVERRKEYYRFVTSGFIHADYLHLAFNMISFFFFAHIVEDWLGSALFVLLYLLALIISDIPTYLKYKNNSNYASLGASGAVSAIIFASIILRPIENVYIYTIPIPGYVYGVLYLTYSYYMDQKSSDHINHSAHFYGSVVGVVFVALTDLSLLPGMFSSIADHLLNLF